MGVSVGVGVIVKVGLASGVQVGGIWLRGVGVLVGIASTASGVGGGNGLSAA